MRCHTALVGLLISVLVLAACEPPNYMPNCTTNCSVNDSVDFGIAN